MTFHLMSDSKKALFLYIVYHILNHYNKEIEHEVSYGRDYIVRLLAGNSHRVWSRLRMSTEMILELSEIMRSQRFMSPTQHISVLEQIIILILVAAQGITYSTVCDRLERSLETVHRYVKSSAKSFCKAYDFFVKQPGTGRVHSKIRNDKRFWPYFRHCIGAIDGSHVPVRVREDMTAYRNRKKQLSMNIFLACDFDMMFVFCLSGWEGSAHDARVYEDVQHKGFVVPAGKYYLGDAGYPLSATCLVPYRGVRYHLREYSGTGNEPRNAQELFNLRHSQLRNVIERTIGVWKGRFRLLRNCATLSPRMVSLIVYATVALHNFIRSRCSSIELFQDVDVDPNDADDEGDDAAMAAAAANAPVPPDVIAWRDSIAQAMWVDYVAHRARS
jgi:hypothetical protein